MINRRGFRNFLFIISLSLSKSTSVIALDCPPPKDQSDAYWSSLFTKSSQNIFRAKINSINFVKMSKNGFPIYTVRYNVLENIIGALPSKFTAFWEPWCDACTANDAKDDRNDMIGKEYIVQGNFIHKGQISSFNPDMCWGFIELPFRFPSSDSNLLDALRLSVTRKIKK